MKVLVACEESQAVCLAFRAIGIKAWSCDIQKCSGGHPEYHIKGCALVEAYSGKYDILIAHPPCTYLANSGVCWLYRQPERWQKLIDGAVFFRKLLLAPIKNICVENPIMHKYAVQIVGRKHDQLIQPYHFGHYEQKATCFWLKNLPPLKHTKDVREETLSLPSAERQRLHYLPPGENRAKLRSKTYMGIALAMAEQWGSL